MKHKTKSCLHIRHGIYLYELFLTGHLITRIVRYYSERNVEGEEVQWEDLDEEVQTMVEEQMREE